MAKSKIEWCDRSDWNCLRGCTRVSPGCGGPGPHGGCYAERQAARFSDPGQPFHGFAERTKSGPRWTGRVELIEERLTAPLGWRKPARIFALSMSDLFHENVPDEWIDRIFEVMGACDDQGLGHTFQILTKRADRQRDYMKSERAYKAWNKRRLGQEAWPPRNIWCGGSVEDQRRADERIPLILDTPAAVRWVSYEPALGPVDLTDLPIQGAVDRWVNARRNALTGEFFHCPADMADGSERMMTIKTVPKIAWVVVGGESGPGARPFEIEWARSIIAQCKAASVPVFMKQLGADPRDCAKVVWSCADRKGGDPDEWPSDLRVREYPTEARA
jgi:protein gp37